MIEKTIDLNKVMDVQELPCSVKHPSILKRWFELPVGDYFVLVNTHDPVRLRDQFQAQFSGAMSWEYLQQDSDLVRIMIKKVAQIAPIDLTNPCSGDNH